MGVDMKSRTSATLRIRAICEYTILRLLMIMFFLSGCDVSFLRFSYDHWRTDGAFNKLLKWASLILGLHFTQRASTACASQGDGFVKGYY